MISVQGTTKQACGGWTRREMLRLGGLSLLGLTFPELLRAESQLPAQRAKGQARSVILLYLFGGYNSLNKYLNTVQVYSPNNDTWALAAAMPTARYALAAAVAEDSQILVLGGYSQVGGYLDTVEAYTPGQNQWAHPPSIAVVGYFQSQEIEQDV